MRSRDVDRVLDIDDDLVETCVNLCHDHFNIAHNYNLIVNKTSVQYHND